jgi:two-component system cell cycle response regulator
MAGKILIVDDVATNRIVLKAKLKGARYETVQARNGVEALRAARSERPNLILLDAELPDIHGIEVCRELMKHPATASIPIIIVTARPSAEARIEALRAGAADYIGKPFDELVLLARLRGLLRTRETDEELFQREQTFRELGFSEQAQDFAPAARIALIADRPERAITWRAALKRSLPNDDISILDRNTALSATSGETPPDAFVIAADLAQPAEGLRLMSELRSRPGSRHAVICIAAAETARETAAVALDLGASDLLPLALSDDLAAQEAALRLSAQLRRKRRYDRHRSNLADGLRLAMIDPLTGLFNRRYAMPHLARMAERSEQTGRLFAVMVLDLDRFKSVNDTFGHAAGDTVLTEVARRLSANLRSMDLIARIGGEEFLVALPETTLEEAHGAAERLRAIIEHSPVELADGTRIMVTLSIGLALGGGRAREGSVDTLISLADRALLGCKAGGRNQVQLVNASAA